MRLEEHPAASDSNTGAIRGRATVAVLAGEEDGVLAAAPVITVFVLLLRTRLDNLDDKMSLYGVCRCSYIKHQEWATGAAMQCGRKGVLPCLPKCLTSGINAPFYEPC